MTVPFSPEPAPPPAADDAAPPPTPEAPPLAIGPRSDTRSLYRKYRPQTFGDDDLVGQEPIVRTLRNAIRLDRVAHAYLFCGPRGTGKTTTARLLAKAVNCLDPNPDDRPCNVCANCRAIASGAATDVVEIDAASNRGIDDIRELRERVRYAPAQLRTKFYIVDEAHQITGAAANAFLKTLEEPPTHTKFVLATTDPEELLPTIVSRCQRFDFRRIGAEAMTARLRTVAAAERVPVSDEALAVIARHATGSLRDALGLLDQLALYRDPASDEPTPTVTADAVRAVLGVSRNDRVQALVAALADRDPAAALGTVNAVVEEGDDPRQLNRQLVAYLRVLLHQRAGGSPDADEGARALAARFELGELAQLARRFGDIDYTIKHSSYGQLPLEVALVEGILRPDPTADPARPPSPAVAVAAPRSRPEPASTPAPAPDPDPVPASRPPSTALRDRVRGVDRGAGGETRNGGPTPIPAPTRLPVATPPNGGGHGGPSLGQRRGAEPAPSTAATDGPNGGLDLERLVDLWPRIRQDVKAVNRRIEALLSSIDPASVAGDRVTLAAAYEFHRDKLNTDEVRVVVEEAIGRLVGRSVRVACLLHGEVAAAPRPEPMPRTTPSPLVAASSAPDVATTDRAPERPTPGVPVAPTGNGGPSPEDLDADSRLIQAAKNIFDAEEIAPDDAPSNVFGSE